MIGSDDDLRDHTSSLSKANDLCDHVSGHDSVPMTGVMYHQEYHKDRKI
jgi:hypothetical protein